VKESDGRVLAGQADERRSTRRPRVTLRASQEPVEYRALVDRMGKPLSTFIRGYVRDRHAAEDLVQETFLRVHRNLHRYRGQASLRTWVFSIARNLCLDHLRASGRSRLRLVEALDTTTHERTPVGRTLPESLCPDPCRLVERDESRAQVVEGLGRLAPEARNLLILRVYMGLSYREIARHSNLRTAGMGTQIARALDRLSKGLP